MTPEESGSVTSLFRSIECAEGEIMPEAVKGYRPLLEVFNLLGEVFTSMVNQESGVPDSLPESAPQRISLTAVLLQASMVPEYLIRSGQYWAAAAVIRQQMEALARVSQIRISGISTNSKPPNVSVLPMDLPKSYGRLSELVHVSNGEVLQSFAESSTSEEAARAVPSYRHDWSVSLMIHHIKNLLVLALEIDLLHREIYCNQELIDFGPVLNRIASFLGEEAG